jgi:hypothetical protein
MPVVVLADGRYQLVTPLAGNVRSRPVFLFQRDTLDEVTGIASQERRPQPVAGFPGASRNDGLIHQIVAEDRWTLDASPGHRLPEPGLDIPAFFL